MNDAAFIGASFLAGGGLGFLFFGGLWWTVRKGVASSRPGLWFLGSLVLRTAMVLSAFHLVGGGQLGRLAGCLLGFTMVRLALTRLRLAPAEPLKRSAKEVGHEP